MKPLRSELKPLGEPPLIPILSDPLLRRELSIELLHGPRVAWPRDFYSTHFPQDPAALRYLNYLRVEQFAPEEYHAWAGGQRAQALHIRALFRHRYQNLKNEIDKDIRGDEDNLCQHHEISGNTRLHLVLDRLQKNAKNEKKTAGGVKEDISNQDLLAELVHSSGAEEFRGSSKRPRRGRVVEGDRGCAKDIGRSNDEWH